MIANHVQKVHCKKEFFAKIQQLTTPEEIEKWREERKRRYPTTQNIILRQQAQEIRRNRGEKLTDRKSRFGDRNNLPRNNFNHGKSKNFQQHGKKKKFNQTRAVSSTTALVSKIEESSEDEEPVRKVLRFTGTSKMKDYLTVESSIKQKSALSILGFYGSDSDIEEDKSDVELVEENVMKCPDTVEIEENKELEITKSQETNVETKEKNEEEQLETTNSQETDIEIDSQTISQSQSDISKASTISEDLMEHSLESDEGPPEEAPILRASLPANINPLETAEISPKSTETKRKRRRNHHANHNKDQKPNEKDDCSTDPKKPSNEPVRPRHPKSSKCPKIGQVVRSKNYFLEKLLQEDIRHERNVLLQCINFVVRNNFFDAGESSSDKTTKIVEGNNETVKSEIGDQSADLMIQVKVVDATEEIAESQEEKLTTEILNTEDNEVLPAKEPKMESFKIENHKFESEVEEKSAIEIEELNSVKLETQETKIQPSEDSSNYVESDLKDQENPELCNSSDNVQNLI